MVLNSSSLERLPCFGFLITEPHVTTTPMRNGFRGGSDHEREPSDICAARPARPQSNALEAEENLRKQFEPKLITPAEARLYRWSWWGVPGWGL